MSAPSRPRNEPYIVHKPQRSRFEIFVDDTRVGHTSYRDEPGRRVFTHTEIDPAFDGQGLGSRLAAFALDETAAERLRVVPVCSFIAAYIERHPEFQELVERPV